MTPTTLYRRLPGLLLFCLALGACGQSGPLYLPGNPSRIQVEGAAAEDAAEATTSDDEEAQPRD